VIACTRAATAGAFLYEEAFQTMTSLAIGYLTRTLVEEATERPSRETVQTEA